MAYSSVTTEKEKILVAKIKGRREKKSNCKTVLSTVTNEISCAWVDGWLAPGQVGQEKNGQVIPDIKKKR